jgi:hypothetical protein
MYSIYEHNDWIVRDGSQLTWRTRHFTRAELEAVAQAASRAYVRRRVLFYLRPRNLRRYLVPQLASLRTLRYALRVCGWVLGAAGAGSRIPAATSRDDRVGVPAVAIHERLRKVAT